MCRFLFVMLALSAFTASASEAPCNHVSRVLTVARRQLLAPVIAKQLGMPKVDVLQSFAFEGWSFIYVDTHQSDNVFLFYKGDPLNARYINMWSGAAARDEEKSIREWAVHDVPGLPHALARCFAWHVTKDRDL